MPTFLKVFTETAAEFGITASGIGVYIQPIVQNHACHMELLIPCKPDQMEDLRQLERQATIRLMESGAFFGRPYGSAAELVWAQNPKNTQLVRIIKAIFDPNQVLGRGKWFTPEELPAKSARQNRDVSELEVIVGKESVSTAPCLLDTYAGYTNPEIINKDGSQWLPRPAAVVLPKSREEVEETNVSYPISGARRTGSGTRTRVCWSGWRTWGM